MRSKLRVCLALGSSLTAFAFAAPAWADASAWVYAGGGTLVWKQGTYGFRTNATIAMDAGVGTSPDGKFILGALARLQPVVGHGPDLSLLFRGATNGFQAGNWGVAIDAGGYGRFWGVGSLGFAGGVTLGAPLGFTLVLQTAVGTNNAMAFGATVGIDVLRLTVYRQVMLDSWPNPSPAWTRRRGASAAPTIRFQ